MSNYFLLVNKYFTYFDDTSSIDQYYDYYLSKIIFS